MSETNTLPEFLYRREGFIFPSVLPLEHLLLFSEGQGEQKEFFFVAYLPDRTVIPFSEVLIRDRPRSPNPTQHYADILLHAFMIIRNRGLAPLRIDYRAGFRMRPLNTGSETDPETDPETEAESLDANPEAGSGIEAESSETDDMSIPPLLTVYPYQGILEEGGLSTRYEYVSTNAGTDPVEGQQNLGRSWRDMGYVHASFRHYRVPSNGWAEPTRENILGGFPRLPLMRNLMQGSSPYTDLTAQAATEESTTEDEPEAQDDMARETPVQTRPEDSGDESLDDFIDSRLSADYMSLRDLVYIMEQVRNPTRSLLQNPSNSDREHADTILRRNNRFYLDCNDPENSSVLPEDILENPPAYLVDSISTARLRDVPEKSSLLKITRRPKLLGNGFVVLWNKIYSVTAEDLIRGRVNLHNRVITTDEDEYGTDSLSSNESADYAGLSQSSWNELSQEVDVALQEQEQEVHYTQHP